MNTETAAPNNTEAWKNERYEAYQRFLAEVETADALDLRQIAAEMKRWGLRQEENRALDRLAALTGIARITLRQQAHADAKAMRHQ